MFSGPWGCQQGLRGPPGPKRSISSGSGIESEDASPPSYSCRVDQLVHDGERLGGRAGQRGSHFPSPAQTGQALGGFPCLGSSSCLDTVTRACLGIQGRGYKSCSIKEDTESPSGPQTSQLDRWEASCSLSYHMSKGSAAPSCFWPSPTQCPLS